MSTESGAEADAERGGAPARPARLLRRSDFLKAARAASTARPGFVLQGRARAADEGALGPRLGFTASKKVGGSVVRNRAKRRLRALAEPVVAAVGRADWDYVLIARADETVRREFARMQAELADALAAVHKPGATGGRRPPRKSGAPGRASGGGERR